MAVTSRVSTSYFTSVGPRTGIGAATCGCASGARPSADLRAVAGAGPGWASDTLAAGPGGIAMPGMDMPGIGGIPGAGMVTPGPAGWAAIVAWGADRCWATSATPKTDPPTMPRTSAAVVTPMTWLISSTPRGGAHRVRPSLSI